MMVINKAVFCRAPRKQRFRTVPIQIDASKWIWLKIGRPTKSIVSSSGWWFGTFFFQTDDLVGALEHEWIMTFHSVGNFIIPTDELIFFRGVAQPPTSYQLLLVYDSRLVVSPTTQLELWWISGSNWEKKLLKTTTKQIVKKVCSKMLN
jgi:hypothetical protein